jgi:hypothetical protein
VEIPLPVESRVGTEDLIHPAVPREALEERIGRGRIPEELVRLPGRTVAEEIAPAAALEPQGLRQAAHPRAVTIGRSRVGVRVGDPRVLVVLGMRVAAAAVRNALRERPVVVPRDRDHLVFVEERSHRAGARTEAAQVAEAIDRRGAAPHRVLEHGPKRQVIAVRAAEDGDRLHQFRHVAPVAQQVRQAPCASGKERRESLRVGPSRASSLSMRMGQT